MKKILIFILAVIFFCGCSQSSKESIKYTLLYSYDTVGMLDSSSFVSFDNKGKIIEEQTFDATLFKQLVKYKGSLICNNGQNIIELKNNEITNKEYPNKLNAYSDSLDCFEYNDKLYWFVHGGVDNVYNSYLYCYNTQSFIKMEHGAVFGYTLSDNYVNVIIRNNWNEENSKNTAMKIVTIDLDKFGITNEIISNIDTNTSVNLLEQGENIFDKDEILFSIQENDTEDNSTYLYSFSLKDGQLTKLFNLTDFGINTGKDGDYFDSNSFVYNDCIYFFLRSGDLYKISKNDNYHIENVLSLPDCLVGSLSTYKVEDNYLICVYRKKTFEKRYSLIEYNLDNYHVVDDILLEKVTSLISKKFPRGVVRE